MNINLPEIYEKRQKKLAEFFDDDCVLMIGSGDIASISSVYPSAFRVDSHFYYLTGGRDPGGMLILMIKDKTVQRILLMGSQSSAQKRWNAPLCWNLDHPDLQSYDQVGLWDHLVLVKSIFDQISLFKNYYVHNIVSQAVDFLGVACNEDLVDYYVNQMRVIKDAFEQSIIKKSIQLSSKVHKKLADGRHKRAQHERIWQGDWLSLGAKEGLFHQGYMPIIAGGQRSCCLHYHLNNHSMQNDDYVLVDAGFEYQGYTADITRVYFFKSADNRLKTIYEGLLDIQRKIISLAQVGTTLSFLQKKTQELVAEMIFDFHWELGSLEKILEADVVRYYPHRIGHHLGIDVHDLVSDRSLYNRPLEPGMVITIEPGIYIDPDLFPITHPAYGVGFRIEDDILITHEGPVILSAFAPKQWADIGG
jgi:Xaa-Pro aminopeptidase